MGGFGSLSCPCYPEQRGIMSSKKAIESIQKDIGLIGGVKMIRLFALVSNEKYLEWQGEVYEQKRTEHGSRYYEVPVLYAHRLLASEPYKFFLMYPDNISVRMPVPGGGSFFKTINRVIEKLDKEGVPVKENGLPLLIDPEDSVYIENEE